MTNRYEINDMAKEESWRMFRIMGEMVEGFDNLGGVEPAVSIYGSARIKPGHVTYKKTEDIAYRLGKLGFSIITGGGPGVMEAGNKGAARAGVASIGLSIELPDEQMINQYATKSISFHHFFVRKVMLVKYATAFVIMPGGMGTMDELTEVLTLMQTKKIMPFPIILFDSQYWQGFIDWLRTVVMQQQMISEEDFNLLRVSDKPSEVARMVQNWYFKREIIGEKALERR
jgi:uncharacterized protein (TIGR00730 family)